jgi:hypothetical protein
MEWKAGFTAEEATLFAFRLEHYETLDAAEESSYEIAALKAEASDEFEDQISAQLNYLQQPVVLGLRDLYESLLLEIRILCGLENVSEEYIESTQLDLYEIVYKDTAEKIVWPEKCLITKQSLGLWFNDFALWGCAARFRKDQAETVSSDRFTSQNYFWHKLLTPEQAALSAVEYPSRPRPVLSRWHIHWQSFDEAHTRLRDIQPPELVDGDSALSHKVAIAKHQDRMRGMYWQLKNAEAIYDELIKEISVIAANQDKDDENLPILEIATYSYSDKRKKTLNPAGCRIAKTNVFDWYKSRGDLLSAHKLDPAAISRYEEIEQEDEHEGFEDDNADDSTNYSTTVKLADVIEKPLQTKTENRYLEIIKALSVALVGTSTGQYYTDAKNILNDFADKGIAAPITEKTLAGYLKKADEL